MEEEEPPPALAGHPRRTWRHSERARLNFLLHRRDLSEKIAPNEGIHVLGRRNGGCSAMGLLTAGPGGPSNG